ncbi:MAG: hypothetical protein J6V14_02390 [Clostridia bacterium]|nr:hypothetical protein [Clostridia bacterium]
MRRKRVDSYSAAFAGRGVSGAICRVLLFVLSAACVLSGCTKHPDSDDTVGRYAGTVVYGEGVDVPAGNAGTPSAELLTNVLRAEADHFRKTEENSVEALAMLKRRYVAAIAAGYDMSVDAFNELKDSIDDALRLTYLTDAAAKSAYDAEEDTFEPDRFARLTYGVSSEDYVLICYEKNVADAYYEALVREAAAKLTEAQLREFAAAHEGQYDTLAVRIILPGDPEAGTQGSRAAADEAAALVNAAEDKETALETVFGAGEDDEEWGDLYGAVHYVGTDPERYAGLYREIVRSAPEHTGLAYVQEFGDNCYLVFVFGLYGPGAGDAFFTDPESDEYSRAVMDTLRTDCAAVPAAEKLDRLDVTIKLF